MCRVDLTLDGLDLGAVQSAPSVGSTAPSVPSSFGAMQPMPSMAPPLTVNNAPPPGNKGLKPCVLLFSSNRSCSSLFW